MIAKYVDTTYSISASGSATLHFSIPEVEGYTPVFYIVRGTGNVNVYSGTYGGYISADATNIGMVFKNTSSNSLSSITASLSVMYIKTVFVTKFV